MANLTVSGILQAESTGDRKALALKVFAGEVLTAFEVNNIMMPLHMVRTIANGKSSQFPILGKASAPTAHTPGDEILGGTIKANERTITINDLKVASVAIDKYEEALSHYDVRSIYSTELGRSLAVAVDKDILLQLDAAAQATGLADQPNGSIIVNTAITSGSTAKDKGDALVSALFDAATKLDENSVPGTRYFVCKPADYYNLVQSTRGVDMTFTSDSVNGGLDTGRIMQIAGIKIYASNNIPATSNIEGLKGFVFTDQAVGTVKLMDISIESEYSVRHQATTIVASYAMGHGLLNPGCVVAIAGTTQV